MEKQMFGEGKTIRAQPALTYYNNMMLRNISMTAAQREETVSSRLSSAQYRY